MILPIEIIVVDNNSSDGTDDLFKEEYTLPNIRYIRLYENKGVAGGRNVAIQNARGDIVITIDDDAIIVGENSIEKIIKKFERDKKIGVLTFKIVNYYTRKILTREFPHKNNSLDPNKEFETTYFIGAGHVIKKEVYNKIGQYMESFYGMEELDLSYRIMDASYKIVYFPEVEVLHKRTPKSRVTNEWGYVLENRIKTLYRNLPWRYALVNIVFWINVTFFKTGNPFVVLRVIRNFIRDFKNIKHQRKVINPETIKRIKKLGGRLYR